MRVVGGAKTEEAWGWCVFPNRSFVIFLVWYGYGMVWYGVSPNRSCVTPDCREVCLLIRPLLP